MTVESLLNAGRKKQLGQYFTDQRVGRLLAALAGAESAKSIIDPMVGSGDLLQACLSVGARPEKLVGIELDPVAVHHAYLALDGIEGVDLVLGDAFSTSLPPAQFDLVITNPPYIRYQSKGQVDGISVPTSAGVRSGLVRAITARKGLSEEDRELWCRIAKEYPGTSDIAVPAWILSAALVREGGVLAVVAPQAWLSRNYAQAVRRLLDSAFEIEFIVEDGDASWFDDAQVRTQLVVARRRAPVPSREGHMTVMARATRDLATGGDLRGTLGSEAAVVRALHTLTSRIPITVTNGLTAHVERGLSVAAASGERLQLSPRVAAALGFEGAGPLVRTLESYGWRVGQGLRSGANDFFYVTTVDGDVRPAPRWGISSLPIPPECLMPAVRRQNELGGGFEVDASQLPSRVLDLRGWVTASDLRTMGPGDAQVLPAPVGKWIAQVASTPLSTESPTKFFPDLAAVATNSRTDRLGRPVKFWYQLPALAARHRPALFVGRVCGGRPKTFLNCSDVVVDANFSGLWPVEADALPSEAVLALLNSSWAWASLESTCTVLGGGALKVEATDLRRMALPDLSASTVARLAELGRSLVDDPSGAVADSIDLVVVESVMPGDAVAERAAALRAVAVRALQHRTGG